MIKAKFALCTTLIVACSSFLTAQSYAPPPAKTPDEATLVKIRLKTKELRKAIAAHKDEIGKGNEVATAAAELWLPDVEICLKAAEWIAEHKEWYNDKFPEWTVEVLDRGSQRLKKLIAENRAIPEGPSGRLFRGYRSAIDNSVQPYGLILPKDYGQDPDKKYRLDVILHGRDASLTEVKFLHQFDSAENAPELDRIELHIYGRGNNAYRWAGERDVFEAVQAFLLSEVDLGGTNAVDENRIVLRGFSMGGAGAWHLGLHHPDLWCSVSPGAGFSTTHGYVKSLPPKLPDYQEACLHIYDAVDYAENAFNVPIVAYGGEKDPQLQAAKNIDAKVKAAGIPMALIVGPDTEHKYHPDSLKTILQMQAEHAANRDRVAKLTGGLTPAKLRFVTYSLLYPHCHWITVRAQEKSLQRSLVDAERTKDGFRVRTENVRILELGLSEGESGTKVPVEIDGQKLEASATEPLLEDDPLSTWRAAYQLVTALERRAGRWQSTLLPKVTADAFRSLQKNHHLTGPIDVAFMQPFLCVRGTGKPWHDRTQNYAEANLKRFQAEWHKYFRGELPVKNDSEVTTDDMVTKNLILFGDPASNSILSHALDRLPITWNKERITFAGLVVPAADHVPVMIYPSPFSVNKYVVVNSGHTFHAAEFEGTNALLFPRLGDYALLKLPASANDPQAMEVVTAGLFDERWAIPK